MLAFGIWLALAFICVRVVKRLNSISHTPHTLLGPLSKRPEAAMKAPAQVTSSHHLIHYAVLSFFFGYFYPTILRPSALSSPEGKRNLLKMGFTSFTSEQEVIGAVIMSLVLKLKRCRTWDEVLHKVLMHLKVLSVLLSYLTEDTSCVIALLVIYTLMFVFIQPPKFQGKKQVTLLNPYTFSSMVRNPSKPEVKVTWIVTFVASWCQDVYFFEPILASLSADFSDERLKFGEVDLERYPELAEEFGIDKSTSSKQLPTLILFYDGQEVRRLPPFKDDGSVKRTKLDRKGIVSYFELDRARDETSYAKKERKRS